MTAAALLLSLVHALLGASLEGSVRSADGAAPVVGAFVELTVASSARSVARAITDSAGHYMLPDLSSGTYHLRVSRIGYDARELDVLVNAAPRVMIDLVLAPRPQLLSELRVRAAPASVGDMRRDAGSMPDPLSRSVVSGEALHGDLALASPDALQSLASRGLALGRDEAPTSLHVHGGGSSENAVYVDGVPVFNPYHAMGTLTALDPDVISSVSLERGTPGAMFGDATAGIIALATATPDRDRITTQGGFGARAFRESVGGPMPGTGGTFLVAFRRSLEASLSDSPSGSFGGARFGDVFAKITVPVRAGELEILALHGEDRLAFDASSDAFSEHTPLATPRTQRADEELLRRDGGEFPGLSTNIFGWSTGTDAISWHSGGATRWQLSAWRTKFDARFAWAGASSVASSLASTGGSASASWVWRDVHLISGFDASGYDVQYDASDLVANVPAIPGHTPLAFNASSPIVSTFAEAEWKMGTQWRAMMGLRRALAAPVSGAVEPRLSLRFTPASSLAFGLGYARTHQYVQSLRNEESLVDAVAGISLPVLAGSRLASLEVPASQSDQLIATADARLSGSVTLSATAYARHETGDVLVAPVTSEPFALTGFAIGTMRARGISLSLAREGDRVSGELGYSLGSVVDRANGIAYSPSYDAAQAISAAMGVRVAPQTMLRVVMAAHSGTPTSVIGDQIEWTPYTSSAGHGDLGGSPQRIVGALDGSRLPPYFRIDIGIRREWRVRAFGREGDLRTSAGLSNLFGRTNALGLLAPFSATSTVMLALPRRSATFGLEWTY